MPHRVPHQGHLGEVVVRRHGDALRRHEHGIIAYKTMYVYDGHVAYESGYGRLHFVLIFF